MSHQTQNFNQIKTQLKNKDIVILAYLLFFIANLIYLNVFALNIGNYQDVDNQVWSDRIYFPLNLDQDKAYIPYMHDMENGTLERGLDNATGIAFIYFSLKQLFQFSFDSIPIVTFIVNNIVILLCYHYFVKIGVQLNLPMSHRWLFFLNPGLIYFSQLISKEIPSLLFILLFTYHLGKKRIFTLLILSGISIFVRMQLGVIAVFSIILYRSRRYLWMLFLIYVVTSLGGAIFLKPSNLEEAFEDPDRASMGMALLTQTLNQKYYIGSLLLNPIKVIQYLYDLMRSLKFITPEGQWDFYKMRDIPFCLLLIYFARPLKTLFTRISFYTKTECRALLTVTLIYLLVLLMNAFVHARYLFPISYNLFLLGAFVALDLKKNKKLKQTLQMNQTHENFSALGVPLPKSS